ncbi:MAG: DUF3987 domain-containing protein [Bacteroidia bacterium]|jgi:hypothetical protein|nr:DUF3987 domain-containing protein [Bacteroidales bacterium]MDY0285959.1 DUF3987 domain-containing protein [Bacteroidales bacterium]NCD41760.1 DUF3987 domain-containing protein [Bacteroidia bacterium]HPE86042.1 DUF3987 domain-containing protein [Bacteroidales bacterium]
MKAKELINEITKEGELDSFPVSVLPKELQDIISDAYLHYKYPSELVASSLLGVASMASSSKHVIRIHKSWQEGCNLYIILVSDPGTAKSHALSFAIAPLKKYEIKKHEEYKTKRREYNKQKQNETTDNEAPTFQRCFIKDFTIEKYFEVHNQNPNGVSMYVDEFASLVHTLGKYNKGGQSDTSILLSIWNSNEIIYDRKSISEPMCIHRPFTSIIGTTQPNILKGIIDQKKRDNGFMDRVLLAYPDNIIAHPPDIEEPETNIEEQWEKIIFSMMSQRDQEFKYTLSEGAKEAFKEFLNNNANQRNNTSSSYLKSFLAKMTNYCLRFGLLLEEIKYAINVSSRGFDTIKTTREVTRESILAAIKISEYFTVSGLKFREGISIISPIESLPEKQQHLYTQLENTFPVKDAMEKGEALGISTATINRLLRKSSLFKRKDRGIYEKVYNKY